MYDVIHRHSVTHVTLFTLVRRYALHGVMQAHRYALHGVMQARRYALHGVMQARRYALHGVMQARRDALHGVMQVRAIVLHSCKLHIINFFTIKTTFVGGHPMV